MRRRAFTLVELLAATALSAMLMSVGFGVLRSIGRPVATSRVVPWTEPLTRLIRADMAHAIAVRADDDGVTLAGLNAIDASTGAALHRPATVTYRISTIGAVRWLVREERPLDRSAPTSLVLMCANANGIRVVLPPAARVKSKSGDEGTSTLATDGSLPELFRHLVGYRLAPDRWQIIVDLEGRPSLTIAEAS